MGEFAHTQSCEILLSRSEDVGLSSNNSTWKVKMTISDFIGAYAEGWTIGDPAKIIGATAPEYVFDDPNAGEIRRDAFDEYFQALSSTLKDLRQGAGGGNFLDLTEVVINETADGATVWCWWEAPGTGIGGSGLIKVGPQGVISEKITYYTKLPA